MLQLGVDDRLQLPYVRADLFQHGPNDSFAFFQERREQVHGLNLRVSSLARELLRALNGLLGFDRQFVESECHVSTIPFLRAAECFIAPRSVLWPRRGQVM